ncbi:hypothetical protein JTE90_002456 [Oedothorax gibbosus]|uniref:Phosphomevalonate kinase n=1 Tax=Oedothorax gibbosus TaxID=931172 RepID=A0AAV6UWD8_9ARAC|nr:hypothetical protein JTE90_002456 [Oedothorax gibbosus]
MPRSSAKAALLTPRKMPIKTSITMPHTLSKRFMENPRVVIILSGKRKGGKDYIANFLIERFGAEKAVIIRLSGPLKERYALENNLDYNKLLEASEYKEQFREKMIKWGEDIRNRDPGYFCRHAILQSEGKSRPIWIVSDARRKTDIDYFQNHYPDVTHTVRIWANDSVRMKRGWKFTEGVDDVESECGLDDYNKWSFTLCNDTHKHMEEDIQKVIDVISAKC